MKKTTQKCDFGQTLKNDEDGGDGGDGDNFGGMKNGWNEINEKKDEVKNAYKMNRNMIKRKSLEKKIDGDEKVTE